MPIRVKELAFEITKDEETNYDKLKAIEAYLIGLTYTYTPGRVPEGRDFVDYFLFDNKKGYCTSFGTAMAILGRCIDIPTRYVEGFVVNYNDETGQGFMVRDNNAHAWAEAYFEGVGWIPFEATPPFHGERYSPWAPRRTYEDYDSSAYLMGRQEEELIEEPQDYSFEIPQNHSKLDKVWIWISVLVATILLLFFAMLIYYLILQRMYKREMEAADYSKKMYLTFVRILILLRYEGFRLEPQDTLLQLANRIKDRYTYDGITFHHVVNIYMSYRYGEIATKDAEYDIVRRYYHGLMEDHKNESKPLKLHLEEFSFLIKRKSYNLTNQD